MLTTILIALAGAALVGLFWNKLLAFLNGFLRNLLTRLFGEIDWYVSFVAWLDNKVCHAKTTVMGWIKRFKDNVYSVTDTYSPAETDGFFSRTREAIIRTGPTTGKKTTVTERVPDYELPSDLLNELERLRSKTDSRVVNVKDAILEKANSALTIATGD